MLQLCYLGIVFAAVFYLVFGITVRLMELSDTKKNSAHLFILITSISIVMISSLAAGVIYFRVSMRLYGILSLLLFAVSLFILLSILVEIHNINARVKMRRFMVLFDIVDRFLDEGKTHEEILAYLTGIQKLTLKEATDFLDFITDPTNHQFLADVNKTIQEAKVVSTTRTPNT